MKKIFDPQTVALIGATEREGTVGKSIMENLLNARDIKIFPVNPQRKLVSGLKCYAHIKDIPEKTDLAIIATPAPTVPGLVEECGKAGTEGVIIISAGFRETGEEGKKLESRIREIRQKYGMRIIGPNCLGIIRPVKGLNASFLGIMPEEGKIAFISQSGALGSAVLDWAVNAHIGFSMFASLGSMLDVDFGDLIDFLGDDPFTKSIMIYMEGVGNARKFMSAARGFARNKPIIIIKPGRFHESARAASSHTGSMAGDDHVYEAAFKRAGVIRVKEVADLFNAAEVLDSKGLPKGPRLAIITNAGGPGVIATDTLMELGGELALLSMDSISKLDASLPTYWSKGNPVDLLGDADEERYLRALNVCLEDDDVKGVLLIYTPQGNADVAGLAEKIAPVAQKAYIPVITVWMGGKEAARGREIFQHYDVPSYATPEEAVKTYMYMYHYGRNLELLYETPEELPIDEAPPRQHLKALLGRVETEGREILTEEESKRFLEVYGIPVAGTYIAGTVEEALKSADAIGYPVVMKISSPLISHKSDSGGVVTGIDSPEKLKAAYDDMMKRMAINFPKAKIEGVAIEKMVENIDYEIILGARRDKDFGMVILFGRGGKDAEIFRDFSIGLPPLNQTLARRLMEGSHIYRIIQGTRGRIPAQMDEIEKIIVNFSNLVIDFPEISEMDINPLAISGGHACALDARIVRDKDFTKTAVPYSHLIITPYPTKYVLPWRMKDGTEVLLRPIRPEDEPLEREMLASLSEEALRYRFFRIIKNISHQMLTRFCNIDYDREMAFVAELREEGKRKIIGIGRLIIEPDFKKGEYAVVVHDKYQRRGLGYKLVDMLIGIGQEKGLSQIYGVVLSENRGMLKICDRLGFSAKPQPEGIVDVILTLK